MRRSQQILSSIIFSATIAAAAAYAQDFGSSGASSMAPPPAAPNPQPENIRVQPDKTISANDYFIPCGQGCSFEAAQESMAVLGFYFQTMKPSSARVTSDTYRRNVEACTRRAAGDRCDENAFLESSLHYNVAKQIRTAYLENATNREELRTLGTDKDTPAPPAETTESLNNKWFRGEGTWKVLEGQIDVNIQEGRTRDNFQFNIDAFADRRTETERLREVDPEFYSQYRAFFNRTTPFQDRFFARANRRQATGRGIASDEADLYTFQAREEDGRLELNEGIRRDVNRGFATGNEYLRRAAERAAQETQGPNGTTRFPNQPAILESNDAYFEIRKRDLTNASQNIDQIIRDIQTDPSRRNELNQFLSTLGVSQASIYSVNRTDILRDLNAEQQRLTQEEAKGSSSRQIAIDLNRQVAAVADQQRRTSNAENTSPNITLDLDSFDSFVESIWPTNEGEKFRQQILARQGRGGTRTSIGAP